MGTEKALVEIAGKPLAAHVVDALVDAGAEDVVLVGASDELAEALALAVVPDTWPGEGPLAGIATALVWAEGRDPASIVVIAACDQPALGGDDLRTLVRCMEAGKEGTAAAFVTSDGRRHPIPAAYLASTASRVRGLLESGERRADAAFEALGVVDVPVPDNTIIDLDTPDDVARWEAAHR
jgi:molybdopterin-guanine dinucleotide biosynthesis protein A